MTQYKQVMQTDLCIRCGSCAEVCPCICFAPDGEMIRPDDCGACWQCVDECTVGALVSKDGCV